MSEVIGQLTIKGEVEVLKLRPGDVIVIKADRRLTAETAGRLREQAEEVFPGYKVVVLPHELSIAVQREEVAV